VYSRSACKFATKGLLQVASRGYPDSSTVEQPVGFLDEVLCSFNTCWVNLDVPVTMFRSLPEGYILRIWPVVRTGTKNKSWTKTFFFKSRNDITLECMLSHWWNVILLLVYLRPNSNWKQRATNYCKSNNVILTTRCLALHFKQRFISIKVFSCYIDAVKPPPIASAPVCSAMLSCRCGGGVEH